MSTESWRVVLAGAPGAVAGRGIGHEQDGGARAAPPFDGHATGGARCARDNPTPAPEEVTR